MEIRKAQPEDLERVLEIYARARAFMAESGNPTQWGTTKPAQEQVEADIRAGRSYVCLAEGQIAAVFYFAVEEDPTYRRIWGPGWIGCGPYGVVHRIASAGAVRGAGRFCLEWALAQCKELRIDTHRNNRPMRALLLRLGFTPCGVIRLEDGDPRLAFEKIQ